MRAATPASSAPQQVKSRRLSIAASVGLVLVCAAAAAVGALGELGCLAASFPTAPFICTNAGERLVAWYERSLAAAAVIPLFGVAIGRYTRRRWPALLAALLSLALTAISMAWAFHTVTNLA